MDPGTRSSFNYTVIFEASGLSLELTPDDPAYARQLTARLQAQPQVALTIMSPVKKRGVREPTPSSEGGDDLSTESGITTAAAGDLFHAMCKEVKMEEIQNEKEWQMALGGSELALSELIHV